MDEKVKQVVDDEREPARYGLGAVLRDAGQMMKFFTQPIEQTAPEDPDLGAETLNAEGLKRLAAAAPPDVEDLKTGLGSRKLAHRITAALWVARFDDKPGFEVLRPLRTKAAGIIADAMNFRTEPVLSAAAVHEIDTELLQLLYERPGPVPFLGAVGESDPFLIAVEEARIKVLRSVN
jgi:hypothetical protein